MGRRLPGWRKLHAAAVWTQQPPEQSWLLRVRGFRRDVRSHEEHARLAGTRSAVPVDEPPDGSRRRVEAWRIPLPQRARVSPGQGLPLPPDQHGGLGIPRHRSCRAQAMSLRASRRKLPGSPRSSRRTASRVMRSALCAATLLALAVCVEVVAADMNKVVRHVFPAAEEGFDPAAAHDLYSGTVEQAIFETLLTYDYLARPSKLVPLAAQSLPEVSDGGRSYTFRVRPGIYFSPDAAFKGKKRELVAEDYAFSLKRLVDPKIRSPWAWLLEGKIIGLDELAAAAKKSGKFDYDARLPGLEVVDRYTLRIRLKQPDYDLSYVLAHEPTSAVAREVVETYAD